MVAPILSPALLAIAYIGQSRRSSNKSTRGFMFLLFVSSFLSGCSQDIGDHDDETGAVETDGGLDNTRWQAMRIDATDVVGQSTPTLFLNKGGQLAGNTGCNQYFGRWSASESDAGFDAAGVSLRACEPEVMEQERAFLEALKAVSAIMIKPDGTLSLLDDSNSARLELVLLEQESISTNADTPLDLPATTSHSFDCGDAGPVSFRFLGPDTIEVMVGTSRYIMQHQRAASGARYEGDGAEFWNKGDEALLIVGDQRFGCKRNSD